MLSLHQDLIFAANFDGNANDHVGGNNGTVTGASLVDGRVGNVLGSYAYKFDDNTDYIDFGAMAALWNGTNNKATFSFWFKADDVSAATHTCLAKYSDYTGEVFRGFYAQVQSTGEVKVWIGDTGTSNYDYWVTNSAPVTGDGTWYHIVVQLDLSANTSSIYVNSVVYASTLTSAGSNIATFASNAITFKAYRLRNSDGSYVGATNSYMEDLAIWKRILTADEIAYLNNNGFGMPYPFTEPYRFSKFNTVAING
jgi:hypothetical protein